MGKVQLQMQTDSLSAVKLYIKTKRNSFEYICWGRASNTKELNPNPQSVSGNLESSVEVLATGYDMLRSFVKPFISSNINVHFLQIK